MKATLGFIGLGDMGGNMAARSLAAGYAVHGESRSRGEAERLIEAGLAWCDTASIRSTFDPSPAG